MKEKILKLLHKYDRPMSDPFYSGIEIDDFGKLVDELSILFKEEKSEPKNYLTEHFKVDDNDPMDKVFMNKNGVIIRRYIVWDVFCHFLVLRKDGWNPIGGSWDLDINDIK